MRFPESCIFKNNVNIWGKAVIAGTAKIFPSNYWSTMEKLSNGHMGWLHKISIDGCEE